VISKYLDGLPLYRQSAILAREGVEVVRVNDRRRHDVSAETGRACPRPVLHYRQAPSAAPAHQKPGKQRASAATGLRAADPPISVGCELRLVAFMERTRSRGRAASRLVGFRGASVIE
jgi:hypothetical protein